jgi:two-component system CheB/CheR fusion protein
VDSESPGKSPPAEAGFLGYVVGIGASAGGLEALETFFASVKPDSGAAFVVVQHLSPDHKSMMSTLLARHTRMPVKMIEEGAALTANTVFLIPAGSMMVVAGDILHLSPKSPHGLSLPIDHFFNSLATSYRERAIGIVLSGTGSDGARGGIAINDAGGLLLAQDPQTAKFDGMPRAIIATGQVDDVLAPEAMGPRLLAHLRRAPGDVRAPRGNVAPGFPAGEAGAALEDIIGLLAEVGGVDFRAYKPATLLRRIERRMHVRQSDDHQAYRDLLRHDRAEVMTLRRDILISVTSFFRDPASFEALAESVIEPLVRDRIDTSDRNPIRVWVAGTSTGEEAYTLAILFAEAFARHGREPLLKIFATDIEQQNIDAAAAGVFAESIAGEVSAERLLRHFKRNGTHFVIAAEIRQHVVFARHNLLEDPSFTRMDLVTCRNALIYMQPAAQQVVMHKLEYALKPGGALMLGSSEAVGEYAGNFSAISTRHKLYRLLRRPTLPAPKLDFGTERTPRQPLVRAGRALPPGGDAEAVDVAARMLMQSYAPASVLLSPRRELMHLYGDLKRYLAFPQGQPSMDVAKLLPEALAPVAMALLYKVGRDGAPMHSEPTLVNLADGSIERVRLVARRCPTGDNDPEPCLLLSFEFQPVEGGPEATALMDVGAGTAERFRALERELAATRESLQATVEELEAANEELQASNEELMASNEELQSANEELQSVNEELYTVNAESQERIEILNRANADLDNMALAVSIATVFVDAALRITRFTPEAARYFRIRDNDLGRELDSFTHNIQWPGLMDDLRTTLSTGTPMERETTAGDGRSVLARILPYRRGAVGEHGAVLTLIDVTDLQQGLRLQAVLDSMPAQLVEIDRDGRIVLVNNAWREFAADNGDPGLLACGPGTNYLDTCAGATDAHANRAFDALRDILDGRLDTFSMEYPCHSPTEERWFMMYAAPIRHPAGGAVVSHFDISHWVKENRRGKS